MGSISSVLAQAELTANINTDIYTVPLGYTSIISTITLTQATASSVAVFRIAIRPNGETLANKHYILYGFQVASGYGIYDVNLPLGSGDVVTARSDVTGMVVNLYGTEESL